MKPNPTPPLSHPRAVARLVTLGTLTLAGAAHAQAMGHGLISYVTPIILFLGVAAVVVALVSSIFKPELVRAASGRPSFSSSSSSFSKTPPASRPRCSRATMRAPVYRHVEGRNTLGGLSLNGFVALVAVALGAIQLLPLGPSLLVVAGVYFALRLAASGRPPLYWQHLLLWEVRRLRAGGRLSAAARCHSPQFPFGPYLSTSGRRPS